MPWKECNMMDERVKFVARLLEGEKMAVLCREFDISRKAGKLRTWIAAELGITRETLDQ